MEGRRHDAALLAESGLLDRIRFQNNRQQPLCLYGDNQHLLCPYKNTRLTPEQEDFNRGMSRCRESVEWMFGKVTQLFAFLDYKKNQKQPVGKYYLVATILTNCQACFYGNHVSEYFGLNPPITQDYLRPRL
jgi:hypothetical protein